MVKNFYIRLKFVVNRMLILFLLSIGGIVALLLALYIPIKRPMMHIVQSMPTLESEFSDEEVIKGYVPTLKGNFTDCLMLENAVYMNNEHTLLEQALYMYRGEYNTDGSWAPGISLKEYVSGNKLPCEIEYSRYWHGYLVILKPFLYFMNVNSIRMLNAYVQFLLSGFILLLFCRRGEMGLGIAFLVACIFMYSSFLYFSLSLSICFYLLCGTIIIQLLYNDTLLKRKCYPLFFFLVGAATSYFDYVLSFCVVFYYAESFRRTLDVYLQNTFYKCFCVWMYICKFM